jgi:hypothetical protein
MQGRPFRVPSAPSSKHSRCPGEKTQPRTVTMTAAPNAQLSRPALPGQCSAIRKPTAHAAHLRPFPTGVRLCRGGVSRSRAGILDGGLAACCDPVPDRGARRVGETVLKMPAGLRSACSVRDRPQGSWPPRGGLKRTCLTVPACRPERKAARCQGRIGPGVSDVSVAAGGGSSRMRAARVAGGVTGCAAGAARRHRAASRVAFSRPVPRGPLHRRAGARLVPRSDADAWRVWRYGRVTVSELRARRRVHMRGRVVRQGWRRARSRTGWSRIPVSHPALMIICNGSPDRQSQQAIAGSGS